MTARPHTIVCISMFDDQLAALDAYIEGCKRNGIVTSRSELIRKGLAALGIPLPSIVERQRKPARRASPRVTTFEIGTAQNPTGRVVRERKRRRNPQPAEIL